SQPEDVRPWSRSAARRHSRPGRPGGVCVGKLGCRARGAYTRDVSMRRGPLIGLLAAGAALAACLVAVLWRGDARPGETRAGAAQPRAAVVDGAGEVTVTMTTV